MNERIRKVTGYMEEAGLEQILVSAPAALSYLVNIHVAPGERLCAMLIDRNGRAHVYGNRLFTLPESADYELIEYDDTQDGVACLSRGVAPGRLGVDKVWHAGFAVRLAEQRADVKLVLGSWPVDMARMVKSPAEIEKMRVSSRVNDRVTKRTMEALTEGETEEDVANRYGRIALEEGASGCSFPALICFGENAAEPHHETGRRELRRGDAAILDVGSLVNGYCSDMTRTCFIGGVSDEQRRVYDIVREANAAGRAKAAPGVLLSEIDKAARDVIVRAGYGEYFLHRTGHGIGLEVHEPPDVSATSEFIARPGMVFSVEPGIYLKGRFGVRVEDLVAIGEDRSETLNVLDRDLHVIG